MGAEAGLADRVAHRRHGRRRPGGWLKPTAAV
jgi:hypothetical protein